MVSIGLPILGATNVSGADADGELVSFLGQAQASHRFDRQHGLEVIARGDVQLANDGLLPIEQFSIGGHATVRGYRENRAVNDNGWVATVEARLPVLRDPDGSPIVQVAPFVDAGHVWSSRNRTEFSAQNLASVGVGIRWSPTRWLRAELYCGFQLIDAGEPVEPALQDEGVQFRITAGVF
jgi:hemolysin activation/secretion protein